MNIIRIIQALARKNVALRNNKTGITSIPNRMNAEGEAGSIGAQLQDAGLSLEQADKIIKSEQDLVRVLNQIDQAPIQQQNIDNIIQFPGGDKRGIKSLDEFKASEDAYEQSMKPKGEGTLKFEEELNVNLYGDETFEELMQIKDTGKHPRDKAAGGRIGFFAGGAKGLLKLLQGKLGKKTVKMADDVARPKSALDREMFDEANKRFNKKVNERTSAKIVVPENKMSKTMIDEGYADPEYLDPNALDMFDKPITMDKEFFDKTREQIMKQINEQNRLMVPRSHGAYKDLQASLRISKDRLTALDITEEVGGNIKMFDKLRMKNGVKLNATPLSKFDYLKGTSTADNITPKKLKPKTPDKALLKAMDEIGGGTGDLKYDADVLADELAFQKGLIPEGGDITDIADQNKRLDLYDEAYSALSQQFLKNREIKKMQQFSKPTKTLEGIKEKGTIDISDENVMGDFDTFMREADPEGYADLEQKIELSNFDPSGRKKNAVGGLAYMLGEEPRSEYSGGGSAGAPPVTYGPPVQKQTQVAGIPRHEQLMREAQELEFLKRKAQGNFTEEPGNMNQPIRDGLQAIADRPTGNFEGNTLSDFGQAIGDIAAPPLGVGYLNTGKNYEAGIQAYPNKINMGFRKQFAGGGLSRRAFLKLLGAGTATAAAAKTGILGLLKGKKAATVAKIVPLKGTATTMPTWFPDLVDKIMVKGVAKKIDQDLMEYTVKELPDITMTKQTNGGIKIQGKNAYKEDYFIEYEPPGIEILDEASGKSVKTKGSFEAVETEYRQISPDDYDIDGVTVDDLDELLGGSSNQLEGFAKGKTRFTKTRGQTRVDEAEARGASSKAEYGMTDRADFNDPYRDMDPTDLVDPEDFAKGGLARLLGE
mgnify:CR=1 FL=1